MQELIDEMSCFCKLKSVWSFLCKSHFSSIVLWNELWKGNLAEAASSLVVFTYYAYSCVKLFSIWLYLIYYPCKQIGLSFLKENLIFWLSGSVSDIRS